MKFPLTPKVAYLSLKNGFVGSLSWWLSAIPYAVSGPETGGSEDVLVIGFRGGVNVVGDGFCEPVPFCWLLVLLPLPFPLFDWRPNP